MHQRLYFYLLPEMGEKYYMFGFWVLGFGLGLRLGLGLGFRV